MTDISEGREIVAATAEAGALSLITAAEIDTQIATAKKYPRSLKRFVQEATQMVALNESIAEACIYALPRDGKTIEGPSARFAEIVASAWGNCRAGARVVNEGADFITAQGVFHDLERNVAITYEVQRRITNSKGKRYSADMIGVTGNAASSIALRNAILKGIPKAFWEPMYETARATVMGDFQTLANRRAKAIAAFQVYGVRPEQIFATLGVAGIEDITLDHLLTLRGIMTAIKEGDTTPEQAFSSRSESAPVQQPRERQPAFAPPPASESAPADEAAPELQDVVSPSTSPAPPSGSNGGGATPLDVPLTEPQKRILRASLARAARSEIDLKAKFDKGVEDLTKADFNAVQTWLASL